MGSSALRRSFQQYSKGTLDRPSVTHPFRGRPTPLQLRCAAANPMGTSRSWPATCCGSRRRALKPAWRSAVWLRQSSPGWRRIATPRVTSGTFGGYSPSSGPIWMTWTRGDSCSDQAWPAWCAIFAGFVL